MAESNQHQRYELRPSRIALGFQLLCLAFMFILWLKILNIWLCLLLLLLGLLSLKWLRKHRQVKSLAQLDLAEWVIQYTDLQQAQHVQIKHMIDHSFYVVVYFNEKKHANLIIWQDQMSILAWKSLKSRVKLQ
ncbi:hypothetical protein [Acinetobacter bereziniae]|uniref:hypothetical protein n=1 Tax=Acinetobacter bereziniae TaxID=106648 RepID=UPI0012509BD5|nr:hypothetical protein [Acinetobacter bereziniae]